MNIKISENDEETADITTERKIEAVIEKMWKFNQTYKLITEKLVSNLNLIFSFIPYIFNKNFLMTFEK
jgi:hypothetical protein